MTSSYPFFAAGVIVCGLLLYVMTLCILRSRRDFIGFLSAMFGLVAVLWCTLGVAIGITIMQLGGSPGLGKIANGHYYVGEHGRYREVTPLIYNGIAITIALAERMGTGLIAISPLWFGLIFVEKIRKRRRRSEEAPTVGAKSSGVR